jgi:DNA repair exonuclease SbcCD nuclease subunit
MNKYIITADWHLRSQRPRCRLDEDWLETQNNALAQIAMYAGQYEADVICIGDIFHSTNETTNEVIGLVQNFALLLGETDQKLFILAGNHDLPQHNLDNIGRSAFQILLNSKNIFHLSEIEKIKENYEDTTAFDDMLYSAANFGDVDDEKADIIFKHILCFPENAKLPPSDKITKPSELFKQFNKAKYIFTGDYHRQFVSVGNNKGKKLHNPMLLNPGCLLRQAADTIDYEPAVFLIEIEDGEIKYKTCPIVDNEKMVTDEYLEKEEIRNSRIEAFIERIKENEQVTFDFIENVHNLMKNTKIDKEVKDIILELMENT